MKKIFLACIFTLTSCGSKDLSNLSENGVVKLKNADSSTSHSSIFHIDCTASKYQNSGWIELAKFQSKNEPVVNNGELSQNAEFTSNDNVTFSASGNFDEGLIYSGSIYDFNKRVGTQIQLAKRESLDLYLLQGAFEAAVQYNLHCHMVGN